MTQPRFFVPEVVQTSAMDCGPASLKALLEGFGISVSYGRLREACQTEVDGTSIDTIEQISVQLGLKAEQVMLPADHLLLEETSALPALVVVRLPSGFTHFVIAWSRQGGFIQVMDPSKGRSWMTEKNFLTELFIHQHPVSTGDWREWAGTDGFLKPLHRRLNDLQFAPLIVDDVLARALEDPSWRGLAALDATTRMTTALVRAQGLERGDQAAAVLLRFFENARTCQTLDDLLVPDAYWFVTPKTNGRLIPSAPAELVLRGVVLIRVAGVREPANAGMLKEVGSPEPPPLSADLVAALDEPPLQPEKVIWKALRQDGILVPGVMVVALFMAAVAVTIEAFLLQGVMGLTIGLPMVEQRVIIGGAIFVFVVVLLALEIATVSVDQRIGRRLETRLRIAILEKIPRLGDRYFHSRLMSDMAMRAHDLHELRRLPELGMDLLQTGFQLLFTLIGVILLDPRSLPLALLFTVVFAAVVYVTDLIQNERQMRLLTHLGALSRFFLDALLGLVPVRLHGAERAMRREHESLLTEWSRASLDMWRMITLLGEISGVLYLVFSVTILLNAIGAKGNPPNIFLLFYWTLNLPVLAQTLFKQYLEYPLLRNDLLRLLEVLDAPDETPAAAPSSSNANSDTPAPPATEKNLRRRSGVAVQMNKVMVKAGGHTILHDIDLKIKPGEQIAIVGPSGAGKSSLVGILLGWHKPSEGACVVDGALLDGEHLPDLRRETASVDPMVQLWNRALLENINYGNGDQLSHPGGVVQDADLLSILEHLPDGMQTFLGESGGLVSGGEGQRVRFARALNREGVRLAILDEPFRGLDREKRRALLAVARKYWKGATLLCCTHDVAETLDFDRVLVIENGRIIEDAEPADLARTRSRYRAMLDAEQSVRKKLWEGPQWRRLWLADGILNENGKKSR